MKRTISLILVLLIVLSAISCSPNKEVTTDKNQTDALVLQEIPWDLSAIYPDEEAYEEEVAQLEKQIEKLAALRGKLSTTDGVLSYYKETDEAYRLLARIGTYSMLQTEKDQSDNKAKELQGRGDNLGVMLATDTAFAMPELFANKDTFLDQVAEDPRMKPYLLWFKRDRITSTHTLPESEEQLLQPIYQLQNGAYYLYSTLMESDLTYPNIKFPDGVERPADENNYDAAYNREYTQEFRLAYYNAMMQPYGQFRNTLAQNMQNFYTAQTQLAASHGYQSALEASLISEDTPESVYHGVISAADQAKPSLDRYFTLLSKSLGVKTLYSFETNASLAKDPGTVYPYSDAQKLVKEALTPLGEDYTKMLDLMFSGNAIDVYPADNKASGAFAASVPGTHPFILLNYQDDFNSVSTLTHELGHAIHMMYSQTQECGYSQNATSLSSEVTSTLNELLLSDYLIENAKTEEERKYYTSQQMSTLYGTFFTQVFFAKFQEEAVRLVEDGGTLTADILDDLWMQTAEDSYGELFTKTEAYAYGWTRIPHFYNGFYVYQYAVGIAAACNIADRIQAGDSSAVEDYLAFLKAGDTGNIVELLDIAGVDIENGDYISAFNTRFEWLITEFENN